MRDSIDVTANVKLYVPISHQGSVGEDHRVAISALQRAVAAIRDAELDPHSVRAEEMKGHAEYSDFLVEGVVRVSVDEQRAWERAGGDLVDAEDRHSELLKAAEQRAEERLADGCSNGLSFDVASVRAS